MLAEPVERLVVVLVAQVGQLVHHHHAEQILRQVLEDGRHAQLGKGVDEGLLQVFAGAGVTTPEDLIKTPIDQLATQTGLDMGDLAKLRQRAISWLAVTETPNH